MRSSTAAAWRSRRSAAAHWRSPSSRSTCASGVLSADETELNGKELGEVDIFELGDAQEINGEVPSCDGVQAGLTLTAGAAAALGAPDFAGAFVGDACVVPED